MPAHQTAVTATATINHRVSIAKNAGVKSGSPTPHTKKVGSVTAEQVREIAQTKMQDLNANDLDQASKIIAGTARSMGLTVSE